ncbi:AAA family ATPase [Metabacillus sp. SLBN-84]
MIKKIIKIRGVGRYSNFSASDMKINSFFEKLNVIYANNGSGKTTLTAILKSLETGKPKVITSRKTIGFNEDQEVKLLSEVEHVFKKNKWNRRMPTIEIFDTFFINNNIYSGFETSISHKKNLHQFVIGESGVQLAEEIKVIKNDITKHKEQLQSLELKIVKHIKIHTIKEFLKLKPDIHIDKKIDIKKKELEISMKQKDIQAINKFGLVPELNFPFDITNIKYVLEKNLINIDQEYIETVKSHIKKLQNKGIENPEKWIGEGFESINLDNEKSCPFCTQSIENSGQLLISYEQFFNDEYNRLKASCEKLSNELKEYNLSLEIERIKSFYSRNKALVEFWNPLLKSNVATTIDFETKIEDLYNVVLEDVNEKLKNPICRVNTENLESLKEELDKINYFIEFINNQFNLSNIDIDMLKKQTADLNTIENELDRLTECQKRYKEPVLTYCNNYLEKEKKLKLYNKENKEKQQQLNNYTKQTFELYGRKINEYLRLFSTKFEIKDLKSVIVGRSKDPSVNYVLTLNGKEISFEETSEKIHASKALSDGDRSTLALAFFLAKLELDENIHEKIIIFDDPLSSFDRTRRNKTINILINQSEKAKQTFILSHNDSFVFKLYEKASPKMLTITYDGKLDDLDHEDMDDFMEHQYFKRLRILESFCKDGTLRHSVDELRGSVRIVLEDSIKFRYRKYLKGVYVDSNGKKIGPLSNKEGLGSMINLLNASECNFKVDKHIVISELRELNDFSIPPHHGSIESAHREESLSIDELHTYLNQTLTLIYEKL